jgi:hypothetical protein
MIRDQENSYYILLYKKVQFEVRKFSNGKLMQISNFNVLFSSVSSKTWQIWYSNNVNIVTEPTSITNNDPL